MSTTSLILRLAQFVIWCQANEWQDEAEAIGWLYEQVLRANYGPVFERVECYGQHN